MLISKLKNFLINSFNYIFSLIFLFLFICLIFMNNSSTFSYKIIPQIVSFLIILSLIVLIPSLILKKSNWKNYLKNNYKNVLFFCMIFLILLQLYVVCLASTSIGWDAGIVVSAATTDNLNDGTYFYSYFSTYPNNLFLMFVFRIISSIFGSTEVWYKLNILSIISIDATLLLVFFIVKKIKNLKVAYLSLLLSSLTFGLFAWIIVPYSDVLAMPFTIGTYALYLKYCDLKNKSLKVKYIYAIFSGLFIFIGYLIKPTVIIAFIGIVLCIVLFNLNNIFNIKNATNKINLLSKVMPFILIIITLFASNFAWNSYIYSQKIITLNKDLKMPMSHFIMIGLSNVNGMYGTWNEEDVNLSLSFNTKEEKISANKKVIEERLKKFGPLGYGNFLLNKARWITSEGNFFFGGEGNFANFKIDDNSPFICNIIYKNGKYDNLYQYIIQGIWMCTLFLIVISNMYYLKIRGINNFDYFTFSVIIFGILLFILLFEGRSRYLILYLPFFTIYAARGLNFLVGSIISK